MAATFSGNVTPQCGLDTGHLREKIAARHAEIANAAQRPATPVQQRASVLDASARARLLAYQTGLKQAVHFFEQMFSLADEVVFLRARIESLEAARASEPPHLASVEKRTTKKV